MSPFTNSNERVDERGNQLILQAIYDLSFSISIASDVLHQNSLIRSFSLSISRNSKKTKITKISVLDCNMQISFEDVFFEQVVGERDMGE